MEMEVDIFLNAACLWASNRFIQMYDPLISADGITEFSNYNGNHTEFDIFKLNDGNSGVVFACE